MRKLQLKLTPPPWAKGPLIILFGLLSGLVWALLARLIDSQSIRHMLASLTAPNLWLTALFLALAVLALSLLTRSLFAGNLLAGLVVVILFFINYFKVLITSIPLSIGDFSLIGQVGDIASLNREAIQFGRNSILAVAAGILWLAIALFFSKPLRIRWYWSLSGAAAAVLAFVLLFWMGADRVVYTPLEAEISRSMSQTAANERCGVLLGLWRSFFRQTTRDLGENYSQEYMDDVAAQAEDYTAGLTAAGQKQQPNILFILSESFFDVTELDGVTYESDPVPEFHALQKEGVSGSFYTRTLGYGTCNIELEIMTGINTALLSGEDLYSMDPVTFSYLPSVPSLLRDNGYYTAMFHLFDDSIYHRTGFFSQLGFENLYFSPDLAEIYPPAAKAEDYWAYLNTRIAGRFYSDDLMTDLFISLYEQRKEQSDAPVFLYGISMENHSTYTDGKYPAEQITVSPSSALTGEAEESLLAVSQGISNASAALGRLVDYFRTVDEPTVIVFYGDHRPGLGLSEGGTVYSQLGMVSADTSQWSLEDFARLYSTDYLIWSNDPDYLPAEAGSTLDSSSNYLGVELLELAGVEQPLYWKLLAQLSQYRSADTAMYHRALDGELSRELPQEGMGAQGLSLLTDLLNDAIYGKQYVTKRIS